jgi:hypothetical protein
MSRSMQLPLPPTLVKRVADTPETDVNAVDTHLAGQIVAATIGDEPLKVFGDKGQVSRWKSGENPNLAKLIATTERRKRMAKALLQSCDDVEIVEELRIIEKRKG